MSQTELVFAETSPYGSVEAIIEQDDQVAYFYLRAVANNKFGMKSCWIRNLVDAKEELDRTRLEAGMAPPLPAPFCKSKNAQPRLIEKSLRVVWFEEGDGAALLEGDDVIAVIPAWSGQEDFCGYALECASPSPFCWPMPTSEVLKNRISNADLFWGAWQTDESPWDTFEPRLLGSYEKVFGTATNYYSIDGGQWPPKTLARFAWENKTVVMTVGNSICPQPAVEMAFETPGLMRRCEIATCFSEAIPDVLIDSYCRYISGQVAMPWNQLTFLAHGHTISCDLFLKSSSLPDFSSVLLASQEELNVLTQVQLPDVFGDRVNLLWSIPLFENERKFLAETQNYDMLFESLCQNGLPLIGDRPLLF